MCLFYGHDKGFRQGVVASWKKRWRLILFFVFSSDFPGWYFIFNFLVCILQLWSSFFLSHLFLFPPSYPLCVSSITSSFYYRGFFLYFFSHLFFRNLFLSCFRFRSYVFLVLRPSIPPRSLYSCFMRCSVARARKSSCFCLRGKLLFGRLLSRSPCWLSLTAFVSGFVATSEGLCC